MKPFPCVRSIALALTVFAIGSLSVGNPESANAARPNVVLFLVDDLGYADLGCYGSTYHQTPRIDALAASGVRFTQAYAAASICSPTRASLLTGRHPVRIGITDWIPGMPASRYAAGKFQHVDDRDELPLSEITLAERFAAVDYQTYFLGKWHLGNEGFLPTDQGFDVNVGGSHFGSPPGGYYSPWTNPRIENREPGEYLTTRLTDEAVDLIDQADSSKPFFLMMSYYNVHAPIQADRRTVEEYRKIASDRFHGPTPSESERDSLTRMRQDNPDYASMVAAVDTSVGRILDQLEQQKIADQTIVVFFSDNGGLATMPERRKRQLAPTCNSPLRSGKGWLYEGGIREPLIIRVPGIAPAGAVTDAVASSCDLLPTLAQLCDLPADPDTVIDGISLTDALIDPSLTSVDRASTDSARTLHWHYPHYHGSGWQPGAAIRQGDWKLIEFYEEDSVELYDLADDPSERTDQAGTYPEVRDRLRQSLRRWQKDLGATMPTPRAHR